MKNIRNKKVERVGLILTILFLVNVVIWLFLDHIAPDNAFPHLLIFGAVAIIFFFCYLIFFAYTMGRVFRCTKEYSRSSTVRCDNATS